MTSKDAIAAAQLRYRETHREEINARARARYVQNKDKERERRRAAFEADPERVRSYWRKHEAENKGKRLEKNRRYDRENRDKRLAYDAAHKARNAATNAAWERANRLRRKAKHQERQSSDINYRLRRALRARLKTAMKRGYKTTSAVTALGCSLAEFRAHLEARFLPGMSWDNYGRGGWHIDHVRELALFDLTDPEQARAACHYTNLQPLWQSVNISKGSRVRWGKGGQAFVEWVATATI